MNKHDTPMKLIEYKNVFDCDVEFQDEYKYIFKHALYQNFLKGQLKNPYDKTVFGVGMLGDGKYMSKYPDKKNWAKDYVCWRTILARCYAHSKKYPAYYNITTMSDEWLNFQIFALWYEKNKYEIPDGERLEIDKDILFPTNKQYSPEKCILVPQKINLLFTNKTNNTGLPNGIRMSNGKYLAMYNTEYLGIHNTLEQAFRVYANKKENAIKSIANEYKKYIPEKLYNALYKYEVKIENDKNYKEN